MRTTHPFTPHPLTPTLNLIYILSLQCQSLQDELEDAQRAFEENLREVKRERDVYRERLAAIEKEKNVVVG